MAKNIQLEPISQVLSLKGEICFTNAMDVYQDNLEFLSHHKNWIIDFSKVERITSAALALIIEWIKLAKQIGTVIRFQNLPSSITDIAEVAGLKDWLMKYIEDK